MDRESFIQLTTSLYRLTLLFPKKEPLRYKIRELADEILGNCLRAETAEARPPSVLKDLEILDSFFEVVIAQNWVSPFELFQVQKEYSKIKEEIEKTCETREPETIRTAEMTVEEMAISTPQNSLFQSQARINERQKRIIEILREKERAQVWEVKQIFPEVTKRTLRRDFEQLLKQGLVERIGEKNNTFYQLKTNLIREK